MVSAERRVCSSPAFSLLAHPHATSADARYRHAFLNFKTLVTAWVPVASEADWTLPHLPAKDLMHRIYRDVRFSKDKTPYKRYLCASHSRTGRKGPFALYYLHIQPGGKSFLGCGCWSPQANELKLIRNAILRDPKPLRKVLADKEFVRLFGSDKPRLDGKRGGIFNADDQLKNAPKIEGVDKTHKDIDLLKCVVCLRAVKAVWTDGDCAQVPLVRRRDVLSGRRRPRRRLSRHGQARDGDCRAVCPAAERGA